MGYDFNSDKPIYLQIIDIIKESVVSGKYKPEEKLPSVREMSLMYGVNPNTIQKALLELEEDGLIFTERTNGKFVTKDQEVITKIQKEMIDFKIENFFLDMERIGLNKEEALKIINGTEGNEE